MFTRTTFFWLRLVALCLLPSSASATHVSCGDVITEDTTLDNDLIDCPGDGVVIGASGITLDLAGHTIDGLPGGLGNQGVQNSGADNVTIANGRIQEFQDGVLIRSSDANLLTGLAVAVVGAGVHLDQASSTQIVGNDIHSAGTGILVSEGELQRDSTATRYRTPGRGYYDRAVCSSNTAGAQRLSDNEVFGNVIGVFTTENVLRVSGNWMVENDQGRADRAWWCSQRSRGTR